MFGAKLIKRIIKRYQRYKLLSPMCGDREVKEIDHYGKELQ